MKFQFCGGVPCPEWFLAESSILTKITAIKLRLITSNLIIFLLQGSDITAKIMKLLEGSAFTESQINALISTLEFIIRNSIAFNISETTLNKELVDLGLPKENVESIVKSYKQSMDKLKEKFTTQYPKVGCTPEISASVSQLIGEGDGVSTFADVTLKFSNGQKQIETENFIMTAGMLEELIFSLEKAKKAMKQLETTTNN